MAIRFRPGRQFSCIERGWTDQYECPLDFPEVEYPLFYRLFRRMCPESIYKTMGYKNRFWEYCPRWFPLAPSVSQNGRQNVI